LTAAVLGFLCYKSYLGQYGTSIGREKLTPPSPLFSRNAITRRIKNKTHLRGMYAKNVLKKGYKMKRFSSFLMVNSPKQKQFEGSI